MSTSIPDKVKTIYIAKDTDDNGKARYAMGYNKRQDGRIDYDTTGRYNQIKFYAKRATVVSHALKDFNGFGYTRIDFVDVDF